MWTVTKRLTTANWRIWPECKDQNAPFCYLLWGTNGRIKPKYSAKILLQYHFVLHKSHKEYPGMEPEPLRWEATTDLLESRVSIIPIFHSTQGTFASCSSQQLVECSYRTCSLGSRSAAIWIMHTAAGLKVLWVTSRHEKERFRLNISFRFNWISRTLNWEMWRPAALDKKY